MGLAYDAIEGEEMPDPVGFGGGSGAGSLLG